jgi:hypothetical protein
VLRQRQREFATCLEFSLSGNASRADAVFLLRRKGPYMSDDTIVLICCESLGLSVEKATCAFAGPGGQWAQSCPPTYAKRLAASLLANKGFHMLKVSIARLAAVAIALTATVGLGIPVAHADASNVTRDSTFSFASYTCSTSTTVQTGAVTAGDYIFIGAGSKDSLGPDLTDSQGNFYFRDNAQSAGGPLTIRKAYTWDTQVSTTSSTGITITVPCAGAYVAGSGEVVTAAAGTTAHFSDVYYGLSTSWADATSATATASRSVPDANDYVFGFAYTREARSLVTSGTNVYHDDGYKHNNTSGTADSVDNIGSSYVTWAANSYPAMAFSTGSTASWGIFVSTLVHFS